MDARRGRTSGWEVLVDQATVDGLRDTKILGRRRPRVWAMVALLVLGIVTAIVGVRWSSDGSTHQIRGTFTVEDDQDANLPVGSHCEYGRDPSSRLEVGRPVIVRDRRGAVLGTGVLRSGLRINVTDPNGWISVCRFSFAVDVRDSDAYVVGVGADDPAIFTRTWLETKTWSVALTASS